MLGLTIELDAYLPGASARARSPAGLAGARRAAGGALRRRPASIPPTRATCSRLLDRATDGCVSGEFAAMVTAPVQKSVINDAGVPFTGHTEYLAARTGAAHPVMLLAAGHAARGARHHAPAAARGQRCDHARRCSTRRCASSHDDVRRLWASRGRASRCAASIRTPARAGTSAPRTATSSRRPSSARAPRGMLVDGPLPADTVFVPRALSNYDVVLAMYHDQGLPVLKHAGFGHAVNVTLGSAHRAHLRGPRHGARSRRHRPRRCRQPASPPRRLAHRVRGQRIRGRATPRDLRAQAFRPAFPARPRRARAHRARNCAAPRRSALLEIGPGRGALTERLIGLLAHARCHRDRPRPRRAAARSAGAHRGLRAARAPTRSSSTSRRWRACAATGLRVIGNLPYNISTPLLFHVAAAHEHIDDLHVMLQKEVIDRIAAAPGSEYYGRLTVMLAPWFEAQASVRRRPGRVHAARRGSGRPWRASPCAAKPAFAVPPAFARTVSAALLAAPQDACAMRLRPSDRCRRAHRRRGHRSGLRPETLSPARVRQRLARRFRRPFIAPS